MTDAPERIWAMCTAEQNWDEPIATPHKVGHSHAYTRTDIHTAALAERDAVIADLREVLEVVADGATEDYTDNYALARAALSRAEKAMKGGADV